MRDAGRHRTQRAEAFLLDHAALRFLEAGEGLFEFAGALADGFFEEPFLVAKEQVLAARA